VDNKPWQLRLKKLGLSQKALAQAVGKTEKNIGKGLKGDWEIGVPQWLRAQVIALETMTEAQRRQWLEALEEERRSSASGN